jgi:hypothetical protein
MSGCGSAKIGLVFGVSLGAVVLLSHRPGRAQPSPPEPFSPGETLTYDLSWQIFPAGQVVATLARTGQGAKDAYEVKAAALSKGFVSLLYTVHDEIRSVFDPATACSESISKNINEGRRHKDTRIVFDSARRLAILDERDLATQAAPTKHAENQIPACVEDVVSAFYFIRRQRLRVGQQIRLPINDGSKTSDVRVEVQALEKVRTPLGIEMAFRVEPTVFGGLLKRKGRMLIWFSDDERHLPLRIKATISLGTITADLKSVSAAPPAGLSPATH